MPPPPEPPPAASPATPPPLGAAAPPEPPCARAPAPEPASRADEPPLPPPIDDIIAGFPAEPPAPPVIPDEGFDAFGESSPPLASVWPLDWEPDRHSQREKPSWLSRHVRRPVAPSPHVHGLASPATHNLGSESAGDEDEHAAVSVTPPTTHSAFNGKTANPSVNRTQRLDADALTQLAHHSRRRGHVKVTKRIASSCSRKPQELPDAAVTCVGLYPSHWRRTCSHARNLVENPHLQSFRRLQSHTAWHSRR